MHPKPLLRAEGLAAFAAASLAFFAVDGSPVVYLLAILAPDLSMLGYLAGARVGSYTYNLAHTYVAPLALLGVGVYAGVPLATSLALVWAAHVGADRLLGYGLKYPTGFGDTHLGSVGRPGGSVDAAAEDPGVAGGSAR
jgi:hypothetical protein